MQKSILTYYFIFSFVAGACIYVAQKTLISLPDIINFYVNDFLIIPIILTICLFILRWSRGDLNYKIPFWIILYLATFYAVVFEFILPKFHPRYTADYIDAILYFAGGFVFYYLQKKDL